MASKKRSRKARLSILKFLPIFQLFLSILLILLGAAILIYTPLLKATEPKPVEQISLNTDQILQKPTKIYIPKMKRVLAVSNGNVIDNRWTVSETGVSYYTDSSLPGQGNSVLYGHNRRDILGGLWRVQNGDYIYLILENGQFVKFQVFERKEIKPTQVEILNQTEDTRLTLYTCSGFLDRARFVVTAKVVSI